MEVQLVAIYIGGLRLPIHDEVELHRLWNVENAYQLALKMEAKLTSGGSKKYMDVRRFHPSSKGEAFTWWKHEFKIWKQ